MTRSLAVLVSAAAFAAFAPVAAAHAPGGGEWGWQPAVCKSYLFNYGVRIDDGRVFRGLSPNDVFCGGRPYCWKNVKKRAYFYDHFLVAMIDGNGVYRTMILHVTARDNYRVSELRVIGRIRTAAERQRVRARAQELTVTTSRRTQPLCDVKG